jgi:hypothetical protein
MNPIQQEQTEIAETEKENPVSSVTSCSKRGLDRGQHEE